MNGKTKNKKSSIHLTKAEIFKRFAAVEKPKLKTLYPFLSADQINHKLKDKWNSLKHGNCKTTPVKSIPTPQKKSSNMNVKPSKQASDVNDTPLNINKNNLNEFQQQHSKQYICDFHDNYNVAKSCSQSWKQVQSYNKISKKGTVQKTSQLLEEQPITQPDIFEDSVDDNSATVPIKEYEGFDSSMDSEDDAVLLRRSELDVNNNMEKTDESDDTEKTDGTTEVTDTVSARNEEAELEISTGEVFSCIQSRSDHYVKNENDSVTDIGNMNYNDFDSPTNEDSEGLKIEVFKSPLVECLNSAIKQQKRGRHSAPAKLKTPDLLTNLKKTVTPNVTGTCEQDNYTTPQMDEILQKLTIHEVKKAPHKRRHSCEGVDHLEKMKLVSSGRRVRRSLRTQRSNLKENNENEESGEKHEEDIAAVSGIEKATNNTDTEINNKKERILKDKGNLNSDLNKNDIDDETFDVKNDGELAAVFEIEKDSNKNDKEINTKKVRKQRKKKGKQKMSNLDNHDFDETDNNSNLIDKPLADGQNTKTGLKNITIQEYDIDNSIPVNPSGDASQNILDIDSKTNGADGSTEVDELHRNVGRRITKRRHEMTISGEDLEKIQTDSIKKRKAVGKFKIGDMGNVEISNSQKSHVSSIELGSSPPSSISSLRSLTPIGNLRSAGKLETTNPVLKKALRSLRSATVGTPAWSGSDGHTSSPCLLSPALSGISAFSSGSNPSIQESYSSSQSSNYADDENFINENKMELPAINQQDAGQQGLCEMFKDVTPPECKTEGLYKTTRMLPSAAEGNSQTFFHEDNDEIF